MSKRTILIIEDSKDRISQFRANFINANIITTKFVEEAKEILMARNDIYAVFFDHDLGHGEDAVDVAKWSYQNKHVHLPEFVYIHSANPVGARNIKGYIQFAELSPIIWTKKVTFN